MKKDIIFCIFFSCVLITISSSALGQTVKQWGVFEKELTTINEYATSQKYCQKHRANSIRLSAAFIGPYNDTIVVNGFWDGGNTWRVRFSPNVPGLWKFTISSSDSLLGAPINDGEFICVEPTPEDFANNPNYHGFLKRSENKRYFTYADGTPFFWMSGILWSGNDYSMQYETDFQIYIDNRKGKKFTVVQILIGHPSVTSRPYFHHGENEGGRQFHHSYDEINPNSFQYLDKRIRYITDKGMVPVIFFLWGSDFGDMNLHELRDYYRYIVARYQAYNVVWALSGEYDYFEMKDQYSLIARYVKEIDAIGHLLTIHPGPNNSKDVTMGNMSSSQHFQNEDWLDFHMHQTWEPSERYWTVHDYNLVPIRPIVNGEPGFEMMWKHDRDRLRKEAWTTYMSGGAGFAYEAHGIWFWNNGNNPSYQPHPIWKDVIDNPCSYDMQRIVEFFAQVPDWQQLVPHDEVVNNGFSLANPGQLYIVYLIEGGKTKVDLTEVEGKYQLYWYNPKTGEKIQDKTIKGGSSSTYISPFEGDVVLQIIREI